MASPYNDPSHWRARAIKTREIAKQISDPYDKQLLENVARVTTEWRRQRPTNCRRNMPRPVGGLSGDVSA
jgi:hypothetical protein